MKTFDKWLEEKFGRQDASLFTKGSLVREVALKWARYKNNKIKHCKLTGRPITINHHQER
jgi:hypothetical protein